MPQLKYDCPHYLLRRAAFNSLNVSRVDLPSQPDVDHLHVLATCASCGGGVVAYYRSNEFLSGRVNFNHNGPFTHEFDTWYDLETIYPEQGPKRVSAHVPETVAVAFSEAEDAYLSGAAWGPAGMGYRNVLDLATKERGAPKGTLEKRIDELHGKGKLTDDLRDWAHGIRIDGNSAAHDPNDPDERRRLAGELREFVTIFLQFVYELPGRIEARRSAETGATEDA